MGGMVDFLRWVLGWLSSTTGYTPPRPPYCVAIGEVYCTGTAWVDVGGQMKLAGEAFGTGAAMGEMFAMGAGKGQVV